MKIHRQARSAWAAVVVALALTASPASVSTATPVGASAAQFLPLPGSSHARTAVSFDLEVSTDSQEAGSGDKQSAASTLEADQGAAGRLAAEAGKRAGLAAGEVPAASRTRRLHAVAGLTAPLQPFRLHRLFTSGCMLSRSGDARVTSPHQAFSRRCIACVLEHALVTVEPLPAWNSLQTDEVPITSFLDSLHHLH